MAIFMNQPTTFPATFVAIGIIIGTAIVGLLYLVGLFRKAKTQELKVAEEANEFVIKSLQEKIGILEEKLAAQQTTIEKHTQEIDFLKKENTTLQDLVIRALQAYFAENPEIARNLKKNYKA